MKRNTIPALFAAAVILLSATACGGSQNSSSSTTDSGSSQVQTSSGPSVLTSSLPLDTVIASVDGHEEMNITFGEFLVEYKYYLYGYDVTDDTDPNYASTLTDRREYIINYLLNEKICKAKFDELGLSLSEEDKAQIEADAKAGAESIKNTLKIKISSSLEEGQTLTDEQLQQQVDQKYAEMIAYCGITQAILQGWQEGAVIQEKLTEYLAGQTTYDRAETEKQVEELIKKSQEEYEKDPASYDPDSLSSLWVPDGTREIQQILISFDQETISKITMLRSEGDNAAADKLVEEKLKDLEITINLVNDKVAAGEDFTELITQYSGDPGATTIYIVSPDNAVYVKSFTECAMNISNVGETASCTSDYGYHILKYVADAEVTEEERDNYIEALHNYMMQAYSSQAFSNALKEWRQEYTFNIDREALLLADETQAGNNT